MLTRKFTQRIEEFLNREPRKIMLVNGARQIGKSYIIRHVCKKLFKNYIEINLKADAEGQQLFATVKSKEDLYLQLGAIAGNRLGTKEDTIIFLDEIQSYPHLITMLKFLNEDGKYRYIASGSQLGVALAQTPSVPIGSIAIEQMFPLDFEEFLWAMGCGQTTIDGIRDSFMARQPLNDSMHGYMLQQFKIYLLVGGMPDAINKFIETRNIAQVVRSIEHGLRLMTVEPSGHPMKGLTEAADLVAMVPMQVYNTLQVESERRLLMQSKHLLIGGGAIDSELEAALRDFPNAVWSTYGMTETLSHIALRRINGKEASPWYMPFDTVEVGQNAGGCLVIDAPEICSETLTTNDIVEMHANGRRFRIVGRKDNVICSGGVKIQIEEVEARLKGHVDVPFVVTKCRDGKFGEAVVMLYEDNGNGADRCSLRRVAERVLPRYWQPKYYFAVDCLPLTGTGKPARKQAELLAESARLNVGEDAAAH
jgi:hypothetical protein